MLRRLATLLSQQASLMASNEAFKKQAEGASNAAKKYMEDNEMLQEVKKNTHTEFWAFQVLLVENQSSEVMGHTAVGMGIV